MRRFSEELLERARRPRNMGRDESADLIGIATTEDGPPSVRLFLRLDGRRIVRSTFEASGCGVTLAACSALTELILSKSVEEARVIDESRLDAFLDGVPPDKHYCLRIAVAAMRNALDNAP